MNIKDIFIGYGDDPQCVFCKIKINLMNHLSDESLITYYCSNCSETHAVMRSITTDKERYLFISLYEKELCIDLLTNQLRVYCFSNLKTIESCWIPLPKLDFSNKNKLKNKIDTLITFS